MRHSQDIFEACLDSVLALASLEEKFSRLEAQGDIKGQSLEPRITISGNHDPMAHVISKVAFEQDVLESARRDAARQVESCCRILYGADNRSGLAKAKDMRTADVICLHYCQAESWQKTAKVVSRFGEYVSRSYAQHIASDGFAFIDAHGVLYCERCGK